MNNNEINIRDPFVLKENGKFYLYGTRAKNFGVNVGGVDVYISDNLDNWAEKKECLNSDELGLNRGVNWAPEVHKYNGAYYMFITFTQENDLRGTYILKADKPEGPFLKHSDGAVTPHEWECLDGTLYIENGVPYLVFCHEHTQIIDGTICYIRLSDDLTHSVGEAVTMFHGSDPFYIAKEPDGCHYITDGPFMHRTKTGSLFMIWSTSLNGLYAECLVKFTDNTITGSFEHLDPLIDSDGGHGMFFRNNDKLCFTYHTPNDSGSEHPAFTVVDDDGDIIRMIDKN